MDFFSGIEGPGPNITGAWQNKNTGNVVYVRDNVIGDTGMSVILSDGRYVDMDDFSRDYVQVSDIEEPMDFLSESSSGLNEAELFKGMTKPTDGPDAVEQEFGDMDLIKQLEEGKIVESPMYKPTPNAHSIIEAECNCNKNYNTIDKLFSKIETDPEINIDVDWEEYPRNEVDTLVNFLDIDKNDIAEYLYDTYFNKESIMNAIKEKFFN